MLKRVILPALLILSVGSPSAKPQTALIEALRLAEAYVDERKIDVSDYYITSVLWQADSSTPTRGCWLVMWSPNELTFDKQLLVRVCSDGSITHQSSWA